MKKQQNNTFDKKLNGIKAHSKGSPMDINGKYEIIEMELWDKKDIDLVKEGYINISGTKGEFHFICVEGQMNVRNVAKNNFKFSWNGRDEENPAKGFGDFIYKNAMLIGRIYFHDGDDSLFIARKIKY